MAKAAAPQDVGYADSHTTCAVPQKMGAEQQESTSELLRCRSIFTAKFPPPRTRGVDNPAHDGIVYRIPDSRATRKSADEADRKSHHIGGNTPRQYTRTPMAKLYQTHRTRNSALLSEMLIYRVAVTSARLLLVELNADLPSSAAGD